MRKPRESKPESKKRHSWGELIIGKYTHQQTCINCGLIRFKALGIWMYSKDDDGTGFFPETVENDGCV